MALMPLWGSQESLHSIPALCRVKTQEKSAIYNMEEDLYQNSIMLAPWSWISSLQNYEKQISIVYKSLSGILLTQTDQDMISLKISLL